MLMRFLTCFIGDHTVRIPWYVAIWPGSAWHTSKLVLMTTQAGVSLLSLSQPLGGFADDAAFVQMRKATWV